MGNNESTLRTNQRQVRQQWEIANASVRSTSRSRSSRNFEVSQIHHNCREEEIVEGQKMIVVTDSVCFTDRRKRVPLTLVENLERISSGRAVILLEDAKFRFTQCWLSVARRLDVSQEVRSAYEQQVPIDKDYTKAMEACLDYWLTNDSNASWEKLIEAVAVYEPNTAEELRKLLGLYSTDVYSKLRRNCGEEFIARLSEKLTPHHYVILSPYLLSQAGETLINEQERDETLKVLRMLQHWKDCWKERATYEALVCVAKDASEPEIIKFVESLLDSPSVRLSRDEVPDFDYVMDEEEKLAHQNSFRELRLQFAKVFAKGAASLVRKTDIDFNEVKFFVSMLCHQPIKAENMSQLMDFIATLPRISWFDYEIFEKLMMEFGDEEHKQKLTDYKAELSKYLNQSILNMPRNVLSGLQPAELHNLSKVYIKIPDNESEMPNLYGSDVKDIKKRIAEHIGLSDPECINFVSYRKGCIELVFSLVQKPEKPIPNTAWDEERQEHKITGDIVELLPDSFRKRNRSLTSALAAKSTMTVEGKLINPTEENINAKMRSRGYTF